MGKYSLELKHGQEAEETFAELAELNGYIVEEATSYSNIVEHIDFNLTSRQGISDFLCRRKGKEEV